MDKTVEQLKAAIHEILGEVSSQIFLGRVDKTLEEGSGDKASLTEACDKVQKMVKLFIGVGHAQQIEAKCKEILGKAA